MKENIKKLYEYELTWTFSEGDVEARKALAMRFQGNWFSLKGVKLKKSPNGGAER